MATQPSSAMPTKPTTLAPRNVRVLVVEDDAAHLDAMREVLEDEGFHVDCASDGTVALDRLEHGPAPDLIVADLMMPKMDGWTLIRELKKSPDLAEIPVVVVTGAGERTLYSAPVSAGYLEKPLSAARLVETLAVCLARRVRRSSSAPPDSRH